MGDETGTSGGDSLEQLVADTVSRVYRYVSGGLADGDGLRSLTVEQLRLLRFLVEEGPVTMSRVARFAMVTNAGATGVVGRLAARGLVERAVDPTNRRVVLVHILPDGVAVLDEARRRADDRLRLLTRHLDDHERAAVRRGVEGLARALDVERLTSEPTSWSSDPNL